MLCPRLLKLASLLVEFMIFADSARAAEAPKRPNIVVIWGDDVVQSNLSVYTRGLTGYQTPNLDSFMKSLEEPLAH